MISHPRWQPAERVLYFGVLASTLHERSFYESSGQLVYAKERKWKKSGRMDFFCPSLCLLLTALPYSLPCPHAWRPYLECGVERGGPIRWNP